MMLQMKATPEVASNFTKMADDITNILEDDIRQGQAYAQTHIDWYHSDLDRITGNANDLQTNADLFYNQLHACRSNLFDQAGVICTCDQERERICNEKDRICAECVAHTTWQLASSHFGEKWCDLHNEEKPTDCAPIKLLNDAVGTIKGEIEADYQEWKQCYEDCEEAKKNCEDKEKECSGLKTLAETKKAECVAKAGAWELEACLFGNKVQTKCYDYQSLMSFLTTAWTPSQMHFSEIDRQHEWHSIQTIKCVLQSYSTETRTFENSLDDCKSKDYDYAGRVGTLDNKSSAMNVFMSTGGKSTCGHIPSAADGWLSSNDHTSFEGIEQNTKFGDGKWIDALGTDWCLVKQETTNKEYPARFDDIAQLPYTFCGNVDSYGHVNDHGVNRGGNSGTIEGSATNIYTR